MPRWTFLTLLAGAVVVFPWNAAEKPPSPNTLEQQLLREDVAALARAARKEGDPVRGAILFHQPSLTCAKCHAPPAREPLLGPDLARPPEKVSDVHLVESVLAPSKVIRKGFESITVVTTKGTTLTGLLVEERPNELMIRDPAQDYKLVKIPRTDIEERRTSAVSLMPAGLVNQLGTRQQFLDLVRYLIEIDEKGPARAEALRPEPSLYAQAPLPAYEKDIDHAGMIASLGRESFKRGEIIYRRTCANCHGTREQAGSMPTSLPFATGKFKNGSDPYSMYQTLTRGFGMMTPQTWMVPQQKYDVIHYIREAYLKAHNSSQYFRTDRDYLARLPKGSSRGPAPSALEPWSAMDYGPSLINTYEVGRDGSNIAYKGIAVRLDAGAGGISRGRYWMVYDHDTLRVAGAWSGKGFIDWRGIHFNGEHQVHPHIVSQVHWSNPAGPGWADPADNSFRDRRIEGRDGRRYGPLPRSWARYKGLYHFGDKVVLSYTIGDASVLEMPGLVTTSPVPVFARTFNIGPREKDLTLQVAQHPQSDARLQTRKLARSRTVAILQSDKMSAMIVAGLSADAPGLEWLAGPKGSMRLKVPRGEKPLKFTLWVAQVDEKTDLSSLIVPGMAMDLTPLTRGGPPRWPTRLTTKAVIGSDNGPFAVDTLSHPVNNPWSAQMRFTGLDFFQDGNRAAVCGWDGDVWLVEGIAEPAKGLTWQRIASGLFQPLGLRIVDDQVYVCCRDQIVILRDLDGDGETDFYECFNSDHQVTEHFHEFAMDLQTDSAGNFYYAKAARHAKTALVPHHGTLLRVKKDGSRTDILATGFRAPNGVCVNPDGTFFLTDQEGHWTPKNRINWVKEGNFYGNLWGYTKVTDPSDRAMTPPVCWITNRFDRSPAELLWVPAKTWGPLQGALLNLSYGHGKIYVVLNEKVNGQMQGGVTPLPLPLFATGVMRGRFHPTNGHLYACGMYSWAGNQQQPGGLYRVRYTGKPVLLPLRLEARQTGVAIGFSDNLDPKRGVEVDRYRVKVWGLKRSAKYGSDHINEKMLRIARATIAADGRTVVLEIPDLAPTRGMEITYTLRSASGEAIRGAIHNTIHHLPGMKANERKR